MPTGVYPRTKKHSFNLGRKHPNRKRYSKGITPINKTCLFCKTPFVTNCFQPRKKYCSQSCRSKNNLEVNLRNLNKRDKEKQRFAMSSRKGSLHPKWIEDRTVAMEKHRLRGTQEWRLWRESVFNRDKFTCRECNLTGGFLEPHHIIPLRLDIAKVFDLSNGITLCRECHKKQSTKKKIL